MHISVLHEKIYYQISMKCCFQMAFTGWYIGLKRIGEGMYKKYRKQVDKNFILALILSSVLLLLAVFVNLMCYHASSDIITLKEGIIGMGLKPIEDVTGYALILKGMGYGLGSIILFVVKLYFVWLPLLLGCYIFGFALIARLVYAMSDKRVLLYRILMGFSFLGQIIMLLYGLVLITLGGWLSIMGVIVSIGICGIIFLGIRGTYTKKLFICDKDV